MATTRAFGGSTEEAMTSNENTFWSDSGRINLSRGRNGLFVIGDLEGLANTGVVWEKFTKADCG